MLTTPALLAAVLPLLAPNGGGSGLEVEAPRLDETSLRSAVEGAEWWANLRWRYEHRDDSSRAETDEDMALKAALGIRTQTWNGMRGLLEFESVSDLGTRDEDLVVRGAEVNRVQLEVDAADGHLLVLGRQRVRRGNGRWICERPWRMNEQSYDAITYAANEGGVDWFVGALDNINAGLFEDKDINALLFDAEGEVAPGINLMGYVYDLEYPDGPLVGTDVDPFESSTTTGLALTGKTSGGQRYLRWRAEAAQQTASHDNDSGLDELYTYGQLFAHQGPWHAGLAYEVFGGDGTNAVQFTLGRRHGLNGFTNRTARIPDDGLEEKLLDVGYDAGDWNLSLRYRVFDAQNVDLHYGDEFNVAFALDLDDDSMLGIRYATYMADEGPGKLGDDVERFWLWLATGF